MQLCVVTPTLAGSPSYGVRERGVQHHPAATPGRCSTRHHRAVLEGPTAAVRPLPDPGRPQELPVGGHRRRRTRTRRLRMGRDDRRQLTRDAFVAHPVGRRRPRHPDLQARAGHPPRRNRPPNRLCHPRPRHGTSAPSVGHHPADHDLRYPTRVHQSGGHADTTLARPGPATPRSTPATSPQPGSTCRPPPPRPRALSWLRPNPRSPRIPHHLTGRSTSADPSLAARLAPDGVAVVPLALLGP